LDFSAEPVGRYVRIIAILVLLLGINDAARLLGVSLGDQSPIALMGIKAYVYLAGFTLALLFAGVGLWIKASWGAVLVVAATGAELGMFLLHNPDMRMNLYSFAFRLFLFAAMVVLIVLSIRQRWAAQPD
jgi:Family of unknown function (DUF6163)